MDRVGDLVIDGNSSQIADPAFLRELRPWLRFSPRQTRTSGQPPIHQTPKRGVRETEGR